MPLNTSFNIAADTNLLEQTQRLAKVGSFKIDLVTEKIDGSAMAYTILGYAPFSVVLSAAVLKKHFLENDFEQLKTLVINMLLTQDSISVEYQILVEKEIKYVRLHGEATRNKAGEVLLISGIIQDITEFKETKNLLIYEKHYLEQEIMERTEALRLSEEKHRLITENMSDLVTWQDLNGKITYASPSVRELLGYEVEELIGMDAYDLVFVSDRKKAQILIAEEFRPFTMTTALTFTYRLLHKDGQYIWVETRLKPMLSEAKELIGTQSVTRDITAHKKAEQEMKRNIEKEKKLNELRASFIAMASHQFRTPLTVIRSNMELLKMLMSEVEGKPQERFVKIDKRIDAQIERMTSLMNDVMLLGKLEAGKTPFLPKKQDIISWTKGLIQETYGVSSDRRKVELICKTDFLEVYFDDKIIGHTLLNLISNAFKYSANSPKNPKVVVEENDGSVIFTVEDYGIGIPKAEQANLFQSFYRANNTAAVQGTGLGLVIAKEFVEMHKGVIAFESVQGKPTTFWVSLPIKEKRRGSGFAARN